MLRISLPMNGASLQGKRRALVLSQGNEAMPGQAQQLSPIMDS
ncbi:MULTISPECIES: hypothetical protein [Pseudomonas]|nr:MULTISPECIES: hypothetical protein [Pseudomonas]